MPRPSLKDQRRAEIVDAYVICAARYGLAGATQDRIAAEAGVARPLLRHNLGKRDDMIAALVEHVVTSFNAMTDEMLAYDLTVAQFIDRLFDEAYRPDANLILAFQALVVAAGEAAHLRAPLIGCVTRLIDCLGEVVASRHPQTAPEHRDAVATGIVAIYSSYESLTPLAPARTWRTSHREAAMALAASLGAPV